MGGNFILVSVLNLSILFLTTFSSKKNMTQHDENNRRRKNDVKDKTRQKQYRTYNEAKMT